MKKIDEDTQFAINTFKRNQESLIQFNEQLAILGGKKEIPEEMKLEAKDSMEEFKKIKRILDMEIQMLSDKKLKPGPDLDATVAKISIALYLYDKTKEMYERVMHDNKLGSYALFKSSRNGVFNLLVNYPRKNTREIVLDYLGVEPTFIAGCKVLGIESMRLREVVNEYKHVLRKKIIENIASKLD